MISLGQMHSAPRPAVRDRGAPRSPEDARCSLAQMHKVVLGACGWDRGSVESSWGDLGELRSRTASQRGCAGAGSSGSEETAVNPRRRGLLDGNGTEPWVARELF